jgi:hypothetical protein
MKKQTLQRAIAEAERFLEVAKAAYSEIEKEETGIDGIQCGHPYHEKYWAKGSILAACKRASMDLTRALSDLRQGR